MASVSIVDVTNPAWDDWVRRAPHDLYHTAAYHRFSQERGEGAAFLAVCGTPERFLAWPYLLRPVDPHTNNRSAPHDISCVYGYTGPVAHGTEPGSDFANGAVAEIHEAWRRQHAVSAFTRFHPLLQSQRWATASIAGDGVAGAGQTVAMDTRISDEETFRIYPKVLRHEINAARAAGLRTDVDETWEHVQDFLRLYWQTMVRNKASAWYHFPADYISQLKLRLGPHAILFHTRVEGHIVASAIWLAYGKWMHVHLQGSDNNYLRYSPFKVMIDDIRQWAREHGHQALHLGGGRGGKEDSLFAFKARFSRTHPSYYTGRFILDEPAYDALCEMRRREAGQSGMLFEPGGFFPAYRAPLTESHYKPSHAPLETAQDERRPTV